MLPFTICPQGIMLPCLPPCIFVLVLLVSCLFFDVSLFLVRMYNTSIRFESTSGFLSRNFLHVLFELGLEVQSG